MITSDDHDDRDNIDDEDSTIESSTPEATTVASRPFTVTTRLTKQKYTFKNFSSARQGPQLFTESAGSLTEKNALYDNIAQEMVLLTAQLDDLAKNHNIVANGGTVIALVPIDFITVDEAWCRQRKVDWNHVAQIVSDFRPGSLSLPTITFRKTFTPSGTLQDIVIALTDGVHRTVSLRELGYTHVRALVQIVDEMRDEAQIYDDANYNRRAHAKRDIYRARIAHEDERLMELVKHVEHYGFRFSTRAGGRVGKFELGAIQTVEKLYYRYGPEVLGRVFELLGSPDFIEWNGNQTALTSDMLSGWCMFIDTFERPGYVHSNMVKHLLKNTTPTILSTTAGGMSREACDNLMGYEVCPNSLYFTSEESRGVKVCCAIVKTIKEMFKPARRPATDFSPKFRDAFELYYSKDERAPAELQHLRKFFAKKKLADDWFAKMNSEIVR